jgi:hypothetical protein
MGVNDLLRHHRGWAAAVAVAALLSVAPAAAGASVRSNVVTLRGTTLDLGGDNLPALPLLSPEQAVQALNDQRTANGIPGGLAINAELSRGCIQHSTIYVQAPGQYPHMELPSQPGYTTLGDQAAGASDLGGGDWGPTFNGWSGAALHEAALMDPQATSAWYGAGPRGSCMGTGGDGTRPLTSFYSYPGPNASEVPYATNTGELPYSPQQAVGLRSGFYGGPALILWPSDASFSLNAASLTAAGGSTVAVGIVGPRTPAPTAAAGFPQGDTFGGTASYVVPKAKLAPATSYRLQATWLNADGSAGTPQSVAFRTSRLDLNGQIAAAKDAYAKAHPGPTGTFGAKRSGRTLKITASGIALGRRIYVDVTQCTDACRLHPARTTFRRAVVMTGSRKTVKLPRTITRPSPGRWINVYMRAFSARGYRYEDFGAIVLRLPSR